VQIGGVVRHHLLEQGVNREGVRHGSLARSYRQVSLVS
jgi:hypothetical protein